MIDEDFRVWLIEVNENPYLGVPNDFIKGLLPQMLTDLFEMNGQSKTASPTNQFELIHCDSFSQRQEYHLDLIYPFIKYKEKLQLRLKSQKAGTEGLPKERLLTS
jgi:hypothetical protein